MPKEKDAVTSFLVDRVDSYLKDIDWRVKENANTGKSYPNLLLYLSGYGIAKYGLDRIYDENIQDAHNKGFLHIHDLSGSLAGYCSGWSLETMLNQGFCDSGVSVQSSPAKHFGSAVNHIVNFLGTVSNEWSGAQAFSNVDTLLAPYIYNDFLGEAAGIVDSSKQLLGTKAFTPDFARALVSNTFHKGVSQNIQSLIYHLGFPTRWGGQSPFSNFTLDLLVPSGFSKREIPDTFKHIPKGTKYGDLQPYLDMFNSLFFKTFAEGDAKKRPFTFPITTVNVTPRFFTDISESVMDPLLESTAQYGSCYFQNIINGHSNGEKLHEDDSRAMCCRLQLSVKKMMKHTGGLFGNGDNTGSIGVVTLNLPLIARDIVQKHPTGNFFRLFMDEVFKYCDMAKVALLEKRKMVLDLLNKGLFPFTSKYMFDNMAHVEDFETHFSTIGYLGMHEALYILGYPEGIISQEGHDAGMVILDELRERLESYYEETDKLFNLEATPAESAAYRLARKAKQLYPDIYHAGSQDNPYFTNSCHLPVQYQNDFAFMLHHQEELQSRHSGGTVVHFYYDGEVSKGTVLRLIQQISKTKIPYFTFSPVVSVCPIHGVIHGEHHFCPICEEEARIKTELKKGVV